MALPVLLLALIVLAAGAAQFFRATQLCALAADFSLWNWQRRVVLHPTYALLIRINGAMFMVIGTILFWLDLIYMAVRTWGN